MAYNPGEPRDKNGKWTSGGGGGGFVNSRGKISGRSATGKLKAARSGGRSAVHGNGIDPHVTILGAQPRSFHSAGIPEPGPNKVTILGAAPRAIHSVNPDNVRARHGAGSHSMSRAKPFGQAGRDALAAKLAHSTGGRGSGIHSEAQLMRERGQYVHNGSLRSIPLRHRLKNK